jgi:hypothetical protein
MDSFFKMSAEHDRHRFVARIAHAANKKINAIIFLRGAVVYQSDALPCLTASRRQGTNILQVARRSSRWRVSTSLMQKMRTTLWHKCFYLFACLLFACLPAGRFAFFAETVSLLIPQKATSIFWLKSPQGFCPVNP